MKWKVLEKRPVSFNMEQKEKTVLCDSDTTEKREDSYRETKYLYENMIPSGHASFPLSPYECLHQV